MRPCCPLMKICYILWSTYILNIIIMYASLFPRPLSTCRSCLTITNSTSLRYFGHTYKSPPAALMTLSWSSVMIRYVLITQTMTKCLWKTRWQLLSTGLDTMGMLPAQWRWRCGWGWLRWLQYCLPCYQAGDGGDLLWALLTLCHSVVKWWSKGSCKGLGRRAIMYCMVRRMVDGRWYFGPIVHVPRLLWEHMVWSQV